MSDLVDRMVPRTAGSSDSKENEMSFKRLVFVRHGHFSPVPDRKHGPLVGVKLNILSRKTLGGLHTDLEGRVLDAAGQPIQGLYAAGEVSGFGGGGVHGYRALEGTFVGGCLFSGRAAGRSIANA